MVGHARILQISYYITWELQEWTGNEHEHFVVWSWNLDQW